VGVTEIVNNDVILQYFSLWGFSIFFLSFSKALSKNEATDAFLIFYYSTFVAE